MPKVKGEGGVGEKKNQSMALETSRLISEISVWCRVGPRPVGMRSLTQEREKKKRKKERKKV